MKRFVIAILLSLGMLSICHAKSATAPSGSLVLGHETILLDEGWKFSLGDASSPSKDFLCGTEYFNYFTKAASIHNEGPYSLKFSDSLWCEVNLPHDWVTTLPYERSASHSHGYKTVGYAYPETSVGWYRKTFFVPEEDRGKAIWVQFDGIFRDSQVWLNGFWMGGDRSGYVSQNYDLTEYIKYGEENLLCVRADATLEEGWFYEGAGIYRHVRLHKAPLLHIAPFGVFVYASFPRSSLEEKALLNVEAKLVNATDESTSYIVKHRVYSPSGELLTTVEITSVDILARETKLSKTQIEIASPELWSTASPLLYRVETELQSPFGKDICQTNTGIRQIEWDPNHGLLVNGEFVKIKGVNMHQDHAGVGAAIPDGLQEWRVLQLKKMGCNAIRASHNPSTPELLDICDRLGVLFIAENRLIGVNDYHFEQLRRMVERDRNHPCIIAWSVGNEEWGVEWNEHGEKITRAMTSYCHLIDPSRKVTVATSSGPSPILGVDVAGYNYILQNPVDQRHIDYPQRPAYGSEETSGCGTRSVYFDDPSGGRMVALNRRPNGPDSLYNCIERGWKFYDERPWLAGLFYWTGFDYRGEPNPMKFPATGSQFGLFDYCGFPKDEVWYLRSWWTEEPVLHILPHWNLEGHEGENVSIWVYSNCDEVQLFVNGRRLSRKKMPKNGHLEWEAKYAPGQLKAIGYKNGKKVIEEKVVTASAPQSVKIKSEFVSENAVISVSLHDAAGNFAPTACRKVEITLSGSCEILGWGNGDSAFNMSDYPEVKAGDAPTEKRVVLQTFNGLAQLILKADKSVNIKASLLD